MSDITGHTSDSDASKTARIMGAPNATAEERSVAASDLRQHEDGEPHTSARVASEAGQMLGDANASADERSVAGSDLARPDTERHRRGRTSRPRASVTASADTKRNPHR